MKPGRDDEPGRIDGRARRSPGQRADGDDAVAADPDVSGHGRRSGAVEHLPAAHDEIEVRGLKGPRRRERRFAEKRADPHQQRDDGPDEVDRNEPARDVHGSLPEAGSIAAALPRRGTAVGYQLSALSAPGRAR